VSLSSLVWSIAKLASIPGGQTLSSTKQQKQRNQPNGTANRKRKSTGGSVR
jgi:hypothetical protein